MHLYMSVLPGFCESEIAKKIAVLPVSADFNFAHKKSQNWYF